MNAALAHADAAGILYREGHHLDRQHWDEWLALYCDDAVFWVPAWKGAHELVDSPDSEVSLMYYTARAGLEDRVWRVRSGLSAASSPLRRTSHSIGSVIIAGESAAGVEIHSSWTCHVFDVRQAAQHVFFGRYEHRLRREAGLWKIAHKKIVLMNDRIPAMVDFYCI
jgi:3-phenylpropionate/cinnamic acid dioxygenase small subunit